MLPFDAERVRENVRRATTEDLLDRATVYRDGMEPEALDVIDEELRQRSIMPRDRDTHEAATRQGVLRRADGVAETCSYCRRPAVGRVWGMHYLFGKIPLFPRWLRYCREHQPG